MTYDAESDSWKISGIVFPANTEYKFRMNAGWDLPDAYNLGGEAANLVYGGANLKDPDGGTYDIELKLSEKPFKAIVIRTGDAPAPAYASFITVPGSYSGHSWSPPMMWHSIRVERKEFIRSNSHVWRFQQFSSTKPAQAGFPDNLLPVPHTSLISGAVTIWK